MIGLETAPEMSAYWSCGHFCGSELTTAGRLTSSARWILGAGCLLPPHRLSFQALLTGNIEIEVFRAVPKVPHSQILVSEVVLHDLQRKSLKLRLGRIRGLRVVLLARQSRSSRGQTD